MKPTITTDQIDRWRVKYKAASTSARLSWMNWDAIRIVFLLIRSASTPPSSMNATRGSSLANWRQPR